MAQYQSSEALRRPLGALRLSLPLVILASLILGYVGFGELLATSSTYSHRPIDLLYYALQLFALSADPFQDLHGPYPPLLEIARFSAPAATAYAFIEAARILFAVEFSRWKARTSRGHAIVCGDTSFADELSLALQRDHVQVVEVRTEPDEFVTPGEPLRIIGDARDLRVLRAAGIDRAAALYACAEGSATNAAIALTARRGRAERSEPFVVHGHIADPDLCATFQAAFLSAAQPEHIRLDFFNINQIAARRLFDDEPLTPINGRAPRLLVAGVTGFGVAALVAAARSWRVTPPSPSLLCDDRPERPPERLPVQLIGPGARDTVHDLAQRYPFLEQICDLTTHDEELVRLLPSGVRGEPPDRVVVCHRAEEQALKTAMAAERIWRGRVRSVVVRLEPLASVLPAGADAAAGVLDDGSGVLRPFGVVQAACHLALIHEGLVERLARVIHDRYREDRRARGDWAPDDPSLLAWDKLAPALRAANLAQARDIGHKLAQVRCAISPRLGLGDDAVLSAADLDLLARSEHERWCTERESSGWRFAHERSDEHKLHPALRPWHTLPTHFQDRCHDAVRELSDILADAGFRIVRG